MLDVNPGLIVWTIVTFIVLMVVLKIFAWKPLLESLRRREDGVRDALERAERARDEAEQLMEENKRHLAEAEHESRRIMNESRSLAEKLKEEILQNANAHSKKLVEMAREEIERDKESALAQLRGEVANLAIQAAGKILEETLDDNKHRKIVDSYLRELPNN